MPGDTHDSVSPSVIVYVGGTKGGHDRRVHELFAKRQESHGVGIATGPIDVWAQWMCKRVLTLRSDNNGLMELRCYSQCWGRFMFWPGGFWVAAVSPRHIHRHTRECIVPYNNHSTTTVRGTSNRRTQLSSGILVGLLFIIPPRSEFLEEDLHTERSELHRCRSNEWPECGSATALCCSSIHHLGRYASCCDMSTRWRS